MACTVVVLLVPSRVFEPHQAPYQAAFRCWFTSPRGSVREAGLLKKTIQRNSRASCTFLSSTFGKKMEGGQKGLEGKAPYAAIFDENGNATVFILIQNQGKRIAEGLRFYVAVSALFCEIGVMEVMTKTFKIKYIGQGFLNSAQKVTMRCEADQSSFGYQLFEDLRDYKDILSSDENDKPDSFEDCSGGHLRRCKGRSSVQDFV